MGRPARSATIASFTLLAFASGCNEIPFSPAALAVSSAPLATVIRTDLGTLGGVYSYASDINDLGEVVGWSQNAAGVNRAFRWTLARGMTDLGTLPGDQWSTAISINSNGQILGFSGRTDEYPGRPVLWAPSGSVALLPIPLLPGATFMTLADRNASGQVTGTAHGGSGGTIASHAWVWSPSRGIQDIHSDLPNPDVPGGTFESYSGEINDAGLVVGVYKARVCGGDPSIGGECWHGFVWSPQTRQARDMGIPSGYDLAGAQVTGRGINDLGVVVGWTSPHGAFSFLSQPFLWTDKTGFTLLPTFSSFPDNNGVAYSVNLVGTAVGSSNNAEFGATQAAAWPRAGGIVKLNAGDPNPSVALAVNNSGVVAGWSSHATIWRLGPGRGANTPALATISPSSTVAARVRSEAVQAGPGGCLSDPRALLSKQSLVDCVVKRGN